MPNMKSVFFTIQKLWPRLKVFFLPQTDTQTGQKLDASEFLYGDKKNFFFCLPDNYDLVLCVLHHLGVRRTPNGKQMSGKY